MLEHKRDTWSNLHVLHPCIQQQFVPSAGLFSQSAAVFLLIALLGLEQISVQPLRSFVLSPTGSQVFFFSVSLIEVLSNGIPS